VREVYSFFQRAFVKTGGASKITVS